MTNRPIKSKFLMRRSLSLNPEQLLIIYKLLKKEGSIEHLPDDLRPYFERLMEELKYEVVNCKPIMHEV